MNNSQSSKLTANQDSLLFTSLHADEAEITKGGFYYTPRYNRRSNYFMPMQLFGWMMNYFSRSSSGFQPQVNQDNDQISVNALNGSTISGNNNVINIILG